MATYQMNKFYDVPLEYLFEAIFLLEQTDELDSLIDQLKDKMAFYFNDIADVEGIKRYESIRYYPNGCCQWNQKMIILPQWQRSASPKKEKKKSNPTKKTVNIPTRSVKEKAIECIGNPFQRSQIKAYAGLDYTSEIHPWSQTLSKKIETLKQIDASPEIKMVSKSAIDNILREAQSLDSECLTDEVCELTCKLLDELSDNVLELEFSTLWRNMIKQNSPQDGFPKLRQYSHYNYSLDDLGTQITKLEKVLEQCKSIKETTAIAVFKKFNII